MRPMIRLLIGLVASMSSGCVVDAEVGTDTGEAKAAVRVLLCQQGLSDRSFEWDKGLFDLCESVASSGFLLVRDGEFPAFGALDEDGAYGAMFHVLDANGDGVVDDGDPLAAVHLVGFSWGGINVTDIADRLRTDGRIANARRGIAAMVLLDPFQPHISRSVIPANVARSWVYRQTKTTEGDCSRTPSLGLGFNGHRPLARSPNTLCETYDLDAFMHGIGHCDVPEAATQAAHLNLTKRTSFVQWESYGTACDLD